MSATAPVGVGGSLPGATYIEVMFRHAEQTPDALALRDPSGSITYGQMCRAAQSIADWLRAQGVRPGDRVAIALPPSAANLVLIFGAMAAGAVATPINISLRSRELGEFLGRIEPALVIVGPEQQDVFAEVVDLGAPIVVVKPAAGDGPLAQLESLGVPAASELAGLELAPISVDPDAPAIMFGTGGTTGLPKAAAWSHRALWLYGASCSTAMEVRSTDFELFFSPMFHIALVTGPFGTMFCGGALYILPEPKAPVIAALLAEGEITRLFGAPTMLMRIIGSDGFDPARMSRVRRVLFGSTRSEPDLAGRLAAAFPNAEFVTGYGATEFGAVVRLRSWELVEGKDHGVGKAVPGVSVLIVGPDDEILPPGVIGELVIRAPWQMLGYWGAPADTSGAFVHGGVRSGDLGEHDAEGNIHLRGRSKDIVITGGENVFPVEVEDVLSSHAGVAEAAVVGILDKEWGERVEAAVVLAGGASVVATSLEEAELIAYCRDRLARYKVPKRVHFVDALPLTAAMKVDKRALRELLAEL